MTENNKSYYTLTIWNMEWERELVSFIIVSPTLLPWFPWKKNYIISFIQKLEQFIVAILIGCKQTHVFWLKL